MASLGHKDRRRLATLRLASQRVGTPRQTSGFRRPVDVVRWMTAMQAQDFPAAKWGVGTRLPGSTDADIEAALADRSIVRSWPQRGTLHFVVADDLAWMLELSAERMVKRAAAVHANEGLTPKLLEVARAAAHDALAGGTALARSEMHDVLVRAKVPAEGQATYHALWFLAQTGTLCLGAPRGKQQTFVLLDEWVPKPRRLERDESLGELAERYFLSHGPATLRDFAWWAQLTMTDAKTGLALARPALDELVMDDTTYFLDPRLPLDSTAGGLYALPAFDEILLGYQDRSPTLAPEREQSVVPGKNGLFRPILVHDRVAIGTWGRSLTAREVTLSAEPFEPLTPRIHRAWRRAAQEYADFHGRVLRLEA